MFFACERKQKKSMYREYDRGAERLSCVQCLKNKFRMCTPIVDVCTSEVNFYLPTKHLPDNKQADDHIHLKKIAQ